MHYISSAAYLLISSLVIEICRFKKIAGTNKQVTHMSDIF